MANDYSELRPFTVAPEVLAAIRPMTTADAPAVALLHHAAMGNSLWAQLGIRFLEALYRELVSNQRFIAYVYEEDGQIGGFVAGTSDSANLFRTTLLAGWYRLLWPLLSGLMRRPRILWQLLTTPAYFARSGDSEDTPAESLFCTFRPHLRGKHISGHINKVLFEHMLRLGLPKVKVTTECDNVGANRQLRSWGFQAVKHFHFYGKDMVTYTLELNGHPRLDP